MTSLQNVRYSRDESAKAPITNKGSKALWNTLIQLSGNCLLTRPVYAAQSMQERELSTDKGATAHVKVGEKVSGRHSGGETPVPISNTAVKPSSADGTVTVGVTGE